MTGFVAHQFWHAPHAPEWELETFRPGFATPIEAALFANGLVPGSPEALLLGAGDAALLLDDETAIELAGRQVRLWRLRQDALDGRVVADDDYEEIAALADLDPSTCRPLRGVWFPVGYRVAGPSGLVDVALSADEEGRIVGAVVDAQASGIEAAPPLVGILPPPSVIG